MTKKAIVEKIRNLVNQRGENGRLEVFAFCANYGVMLDGSTIDRIDVTPCGLDFFYNENTGDFDTDREFTAPDLKEFYNDLINAIKDEDESYIAYRIGKELEPLVSDNLDRNHLVENIRERVITDVQESADVVFNDSDIRLAIARVLISATETL